MEFIGAAAKLKVEIGEWTWPWRDAEIVAEAGIWIEAAAETEIETGAQTEMWADTTVSGTEEDFLPDAFNRCSYLSLSSILCNFNRLIVFKGTLIFFLPGFGPNFPRDIKKSFTTSLRLMLLFIKRKKSEVI